MSDNKVLAEVSPSPLLLLFLSIWLSFFVVVVERLFPHIPNLLLPTVFFFFSASSFTVLCVLLPLVFVFVFIFVVVVFFIPRVNRDVVYMRMLEKIGGFIGFVATGFGRFEHVRQR